MLVPGLVDWNAEVLDGDAGAGRRGIHSTSICEWVCSALNSLVRHDCTIRRPGSSSRVRPSIYRPMR